MECYNSCECPDKAFAGACFSQGFTEFDSCKADCLYSTFQFLFSCEGMSAEMCKLKCQIADCESNCLKPQKSQRVCAKHGVVYPSECVMGCRNPNAEIRFKCTSHFMTGGFEYKCAKAYKADMGIADDCCGKSQVVMVGASRD